MPLQVCSQYSDCRFWTLAHFNLFGFLRIIVIVGQDKVTECRNIMARTTNTQYMYTKESRISEPFEHQFLDNL